MIKRNLFAVFVVFFVTTIACTQATVGLQIIASQTITEEELLSVAHQVITEEDAQGLVNIIAHQAMGGRLIGTDGFDLAAEFLKWELGQTGFQPIGDDYFQTFDYLLRPDYGYTRVRNVIGWLPGERTDEVIVIGAHFDHVGTYQGRVYAGADDNASGTAGVLLIAKAFGELRKKYGPMRRSIVIALWGAEEKGLKGSKYFVNEELMTGKLPFDYEDIVAVFNLDMIGRDFPDEPEGKEKIGVYAVPKPKTFNQDEFLKTSPQLAIIMFEANRMLDNLFVFTYDDRNASGISGKSFSRSDQASFKKFGKQKPAIFFSDYRYDHPDYHRITDTAEKIDYFKLISVSKLTLLITHMLATHDTEPALIEY